MRRLLARLFGHPAPTPPAPESLPFHVQQLLPGEDRPVAHLVFVPGEGHSAFLTRWPIRARRARTDDDTRHIDLTLEEAFHHFTALGASPAAQQAAREGQTALLLIDDAPLTLQVGTCTGLTTLAPETYASATAFLVDMERLARTCPPNFPFLLLGQSGTHSIPWERAFDRVDWRDRVRQVLQERVARQVRPPERRAP